MKYISHRGDTTQGCKENSLGSFSQAMSYDFIGMIETDVRLSKDNQWILYHDRSLEHGLDLESATNHSITDLTRDQLAHLDIPSLTDMLDQVDGQVEFYLDIKGYYDLDQIGTLIKLLETYTDCSDSKSNWTADKFFLASFNSEVVRHLLKIKETQNFFENLQTKTKTKDSLTKSKEKSWKIGYITGSDVFGVLPDLLEQIDFLSMSADNISLRDVQYLRENYPKLELYIYTLNDRQSLDFYASFKPDGLLSDYPQLFQTLDQFQLSDH